MDLLKLAHSIYLDFNDEELKVVESEFEKFLKQVEILDLIDTDDVEMMHYPFELNENDLRDDSVSSALEVSEVIANASESKDDMVKIVKVVG